VRAGGAGGRPRLSGSGGGRSPAAARGWVVGLERMIRDPSGLADV